MLAWSEEPITDVRNQKSWLWRHCVGGELFTDYSDQIPSQTCHAKTKTQINRRRRYQLLSRYGEHRKQLGLKDFSPKTGTLWHCSRLRSVALYLWLIVVISVRQSTVAGNIAKPTAGRYSGQSEYKADSLTKFKEAGGTVREIDVWAESPRLSPRLVRSHHRLPVMGC